MWRITIRRIVAAPVDNVFRTISDIGTLSRAFIRGLDQKAIERDMDAVKAFRET